MIKIMGHIKRVACFPILYSYFFCCLLNHAHTLVTSKLLFTCMTHPRVFPCVKRAFTRFTARAFKGL